MDKAQRESDFLAKIDENFLVCGICSERYINAKSLPCLHFFCESCLGKLVEKTGRLDCPICRRTCAVPDGGVEKLPNNFFVNQLVEEFQLREENMESTLCGGCESEHCTVRCVECEMFLCSSCEIPHKRLPATKSHRLLKSDEYTASRLRDPCDVSLPMRCSKHEVHPLAYYCDSCDEAICFECTVIEHRAPQHHHRYLKDAATEYVDELEKLLAEMAEKEGEAKESRDNAMARQEYLDTLYQFEGKKLDSHIEGIVQQVREIGARLSEELKSEYMSRKADLQGQVKDLQRAMNDFASTRDYIKYLSDFGGAAQLMTAKKGITQQTIQLMKTETKVKTRDRDCFGFIPANDLVVLDVSSIGEITGLANQSVLTEVSKQMGSSRFWLPLSIPDKDEMSTQNFSFPEKIAGTDFESHEVGLSDDDVRSSLNEKDTTLIKPLGFHSLHGTNATLSLARKSAHSSLLGNNALFSNRSVECGEKVKVTFKQKKTLLRRAKANITFGFTSHDPYCTSSLPTREISDVNENDGYWLQCLPSANRKTCNILVFWVTQQGELKYSINDVDKGVALDNIPTVEPLWAVLDAENKSIELVF